MLEAVRLPRKNLSPCWCRPRDHYKKSRVWRLPSVCRVSYTSRRSTGRAVWRKRRSICELRARRWRRAAEPIRSPPCSAGPWTISTTGWPAGKCRRIGCFWSCSRSCRGAASAQQREQHTGIVGFGEMVVEARELREGPVARFAVPGDGDEQRPRARIALAQRARHLVAADVRHADVEQHHIRAEIAHLVEHGEAAVDAAHLVPFLTQEEHETRHCILVVVTHQNSQLLHANPSRFFPLRAMQRRLMGRTARALCRDRTRIS